MTLYARWVPNKYNVNYVLNGGTNTGLNPSTYTYGTGAVVYDPTKTGYTFAGWYDNADFFGTPITAISNTQAGDVTLYAKWTISTYPVVFDSQGGSAVASQTIQHNGLVIRPADPTRAGHTFDGCGNRTFILSGTLRPTG